MSAAVFNCESWEHTLDVYEESLLQLEGALRGLGAGRVDDLDAYSWFVPPAELGPLPELFAARAQSLIDRSVDLLGVAAAAHTDASVALGKSVSRSRPPADPSAGHGQRIDWRA